jgi:hypothetical protein
MRLWIRQIIMMIPSILTMRQRIVFLSTNKLLRIKILLILIVKTVIDRVENHSSMAAGGGSLLVCRMLAGHILSIGCARGAQERTGCGAVRIDAITPLCFVSSFEALVLSASSVEILVTVILIALFQTIYPFRVICLQCLWTIIVHLSSLGHSRISCRKNTQSSILCCL